ncbi:hypothetical protein ABZ917_46165 [Nonomuraea wenchangensis]
MNDVLKLYHHGGGVEEQVARSAVWEAFVAVTYELVEDCSLTPALAGSVVAKKANSVRNVMMNALRVMACLSIRIRPSDRGPYEVGHCVSLGPIGLASSFMLGARLV